MSLGGRSQGLCLKWLGLVAAGVVALGVGVAGSQAAGGALDPTFGSGGKVFTDFGASTFDEARAVARQIDGKIVAVGYADGGFALARYRRDGTLDPTFGTGGKVQTPSLWQAMAVDIQRDGKIVVAGYTKVASKHGFVLARYVRNGTLDPTFGSGGVVVMNFGPGTDDKAHAVAVLRSGKILAAGFSDLNGSQDFALARFTRTGNLDPTFGIGGRVVTDFASSDDIAFSVARQRNGMIVAGGYAKVGGVKRFAIARYRSDGTLDPTFGTGGKVFMDLGSGDATVESIAIQTDGKIVAGGFSYQGDTYYDIAVIRYTTIGAPDPSFGTGGTVLTDFGSGSSEDAASVAIQRDGRIVAAGTTDAGGSLDFAVVRYDTSGALDPTFGTNGKVRTDFGTASGDEGRGAVIQPDGKIVVAGLSDANGSRDFALARYIG